MVAVTIVGAGVVAFTQLTHTNPLTTAFVEETPPELSWQEGPRGLGAEPVKVVLTASDKDSGLDEVIVRVSQQNQPRELVRKKFGPGPIHDETIDVTISPKELGFREGNVELQVLAFDKSLWSNGARVSKIMEVNFLKPQITVLTPQQNGVLGGSELVFYRITGKTPEAQGVLGQGSLYGGFKAKGWDPAFGSADNLYVTFYPIPASFNPDSDQMQIVARDNLGNAATASFNYRIRSRRWSTFRVSLTEQSAQNLKESLLKYAQHENLPVRNSGSLVTDFKGLLKSLAVSDEGFIATALTESSPERLWKGAFTPPVPSSPNNSMGDQRTVMIGDQEIIKGPATGVRFPVNHRTQIVAGNSGKIVFIGELGLLGNTIILDHGFGLSTIYGHLSSVAVQRGASVEKGQIIGETGNSGFAQSEEVYFETRLHGVPVSPNEWWDETWVTDHIENKVAFVKQEVG
jgi:murein DD-endopeptidase MepM/ murein hydrolase activator NlpD